MSILYSPSQGGFFDDRLGYAELPADALVIDEADWRAAIDCPDGFDVTDRGDGTGAVRLRTATPFSRARKLAQLTEVIKAHRDERKNGGVFVAGYWFHTDTESRIQYLGLLERFSDAADDELITFNGAALQWKTMSGAFTTLTRSLLARISAAIAELDVRLFACAESLIARAADEEDLSNFRWLEGWPQTFQEGVEHQ